MRERIVVPLGWNFPRPALRRKLPGRQPSRSDEKARKERPGSGKCHTKDIKRLLVRNAPQRH
jgi:hypothetical protein